MKHFHLKTNILKVNLERLNGFQKRGGNMNFCKHLYYCYIVNLKILHLYIFFCIYKVNIKSFKKYHIVLLR